MIASKTTLLGGLLALGLAATACAPGSGDTTLTPGAGTSVSGTSVGGTSVVGTRQPTGQATTGAGTSVAGTSTAGTPAAGTGTPATGATTQPTGQATTGAGTAAASTATPVAAATRQPTGQATVVGTAVAGTAVGTPRPIGTPIGTPQANAILIRASDLVGLDILGPAGASLGQVDEVLVSEDGRVEYVVFDASAALNQTGGMVAVPWTEFDEMQPGAEGLMYSGTQNDLRAFTPISSTVLSQDGFVFGSRNVGTGTQLPAEFQNLIRVGRFTDFDLRNLQNEDLGEVSDLVIDLTDGIVRHAIVDFGGFLGLGETSVAVPWQQIQLSQDQNEDRLILDATGEQLDQAPRIEDTDRLLPPWPGQINPNWDLDFRTFWQAF